MLIICLVFFVVAVIASEKLIGRINRSNPRWRDLSLTDQHRQQLDDEIAHWEGRLE